MAEPLVVEAVDAKALGYAAGTAEGHVRDSGRTWSRYPATR